MGTDANRRLEREIQFPSKKEKTAGGGCLSGRGLGGKKKEPYRACGTGVRQWGGGGPGGHQSMDGAVGVKEDKGHEEMK